MKMKCCKMDMTKLAESAYKAAPIAPAPAKFDGNRVKYNGQLGTVVGRKPDEGKLQIAIDGQSGYTLLVADHQSILLDLAREPLKADMWVKVVGPSTFKKIDRNGDIVQVVCVESDGEIEIPEATGKVGQIYPRASLRGPLAPPAPAPQPAPTPEPVGVRWIANDDQINVRPSGKCSDSSQAYTDFNSAVAVSKACGYKRIYALPDRPMNKATGAVWTYENLLSNGYYATPCSGGFQAHFRNGQGGYTFLGTHENPAAAIDAAIAHATQTKGTV